MPNFIEKRRRNKTLRGGNKKTHSSYRYTFSYSFYWLFILVFEVSFLETSTGIKYLSCYLQTCYVI